MSEFIPVFEDLYLAHSKRCASLRARVQKRVDLILSNPYQGTEQLDYPANGLNLLGCRSAHVGRNFRIIFVVCEECRREADCLYCFCKGRTDKTVVFLNFGPHDKAYAMK